MKATSAGAPPAGSLIFSIIKARRVDLLGLVQEYYPPEEVKAVVEDVDTILKLVTRATQVSVSDGQFSALDINQEKLLGKSLVSSGLLPVRALFDLDLRDRTGSGATTSNPKRRWVFGRPLNAGLTMGLLEGVKQVRGDRHVVGWSKILGLVVIVAAERLREDTTQHLHVDTLTAQAIEGLLDTGPTGVDVLPAHLIMRLDTARSDTNLGSPQTAQAWKRALENPRVCKKLASTASQVRSHFREIDLSKTLDMTVFEKAGSTVEGLAEITARALQEILDRPIDQIKSHLQKQAWNDDQKFSFVEHLVKGLQWNENYLNQNKMPLEAQPQRVFDVIECVYGKAESVLVGKAIMDRMGTKKEDRQDFEEFSQQLNAGISSTLMGIRTAQLPASATPSNRL